MSISFAGSPSRNEIQRKVDAAFAATDTPITEENFTRAGSVLIAFRKEHGLNEMQILDCIPRRAADPRVPSLSFPNVAAVCVSDMAAGNYP
jgi:exopolysaccharide biosynthesis predicted pyruvyltransferase EpsI